MVLTIRKITLPVDDAVRALRAARYPLDAADAPQAFAREGEEAASGPNAIWLGAPSTLATIGVEPGEEVTVEELAMALQGRHTTTGAQVRRPGLLVEKRARAANGNGNGNGAADVAAKPAGEPKWVVTCIDVTFSAPKSVSVVWSQAGAQLRGEIERAMLVAANAMLGYMTETKPVVRGGADEAGRRTFSPACGFAAAAALHVVARRAEGEAVPWPQLHVHGIVVGVERPDGALAAAESAGMFKRQAPLEGGAVGRAVLARELERLGFAIDAGTGRNGRFFEVRGVPPGLVAAMSGRSRDVEREVERIEADLELTLQNRGRAVVAMKTRAKKDKALSAETIAQAWEARAQEFEFGRTAVEALRSGPGLVPRSLDERRAAVRAAIEARVHARKTPLSPAAARAIAFECAAGGLALADAHELVEQLQPAAELRLLDDEPSAPGDGQVTTAQIRALERRQLPAAA